MAEAAISPPLRLAVATAVADYHWLLGAVAPLRCATLIERLWAAASACEADAAIREADAPANATDML